ncbi:MAG: IS3 family transposase [Acidobacteriota bacterium]
MRAYGKGDIGTRCEIMKIPRSTYYHKVKKKDEEGEKELVRMIEAIVVEFPRYGYRRVTKELLRRSRHVNHKVVLKLMRQHGLLCKRKRSFVTHTTDSRHAHPIYPNLIKEIVATGINQIWVSDITYIRILRSFVYLAVIMDAFSRKVVGYAVSGWLDRTLTIAALTMAIESRNPPPGCIHHPDRGVQYAAEEYVDILKAGKFRISMSDKGNPYDNPLGAVQRKP